jgi:hypothetical protein
MNGFTAVGRKRSGFFLGIGIIVTASSVIGSPFAAASPIKSLRAHEEAARAEEAVAHSWSAYLTAGPSVWKSTIHPEVTPDVRTAIWRALGSDAPETSAWVQFLLWKQSLDPTRFARNHPHVAPVLSRIVTTASSQVTPTPTTSTPTTSSTTPITEPQTLAPTVPEPAAWLLALGMTGWGLRWRRRQRAADARV